MKYELLHLKQFFPNLGTQSGDPLVKVYLPDNLTEMGRDDEQHPCLIVCPGGAYEFCSQREAEPIAFHFLPELSGTTVRGGRPDRTDQSKRGYMAL